MSSTESVNLREGGGEPSSSAPYRDRWLERAGVAAVALAVGLGAGLAVGFTSGSGSGGGGGAGSTGSRTALDGDAQISTRFLAIGDWGRNGSSNQSGLAGAMGRFACEHEVDFVILTGDNFYDKGLATGDDVQFTKSFSDIYTGASLNVPFYGCLGNHDYNSFNSSVQVNEESGGALRSRDQRWWLERRQFDVRSPASPESLHLFFIDTPPFPRAPRKVLANYKVCPSEDCSSNECPFPFENDPRRTPDTPPCPGISVVYQDFEALGIANISQLNENGTNAAWAKWERESISALRSGLRASNATFKVVVGHHPILSNAETHSDTPELKERPSQEEESVMEVIQKYNASAYLNVRLWTF